MKLMVNVILYLKNDESEYYKMDIRSLNTLVKCDNEKCLDELYEFIKCAIQAYEDEHPDINEDGLINLL